MYPAGFRFDPTDEELIQYLLKKATGQPLMWNGILERSLYGENTAPWDVFADVDEYSGYWHTKREDVQKKSIDTKRQTVYVFTTLAKASRNSQRIARRAGCGTWQGQTGPKSITSSRTREVIGTDKMFTFQKSCTDSFGHWIMHEYSLDGVHRILQNEEIVLCKITRILSAESSSKRSAVDEVEDGYCTTDDRDQHHQNKRQRIDGNDNIIFDGVVMDNEKAVWPNSEGLIADDQVEGLMIQKVDDCGYSDCEYFNLDELFAPMKELEKTGLSLDALDEEVVLAGDESQSWNVAWNGMADQPQ